MISSYLPEVLALSDRILVARQGRIVEEMDLSEATDDPLDTAETRAGEPEARGPFDSQERLAVAESSPPQSIPPAEAEPAAPEPVEVLTDDESIAAIHAALDQGNRLDWTNSPLIWALMTAGAILMAL